MHNYIGALSSPPNFHVNTTIFRNIHIINLMWDPPPSLVTVSLYSVAVRINSSFELILIHQPLYEYKYNYSGCEDMEVEFGVRADNPAGAGNFSNMTVLIAGCVITPSTTLRNTVVKFTSAINSTQNSLRFTFTVPIASTIDTTRDYDLGIMSETCELKRLCIMHMHACIHDKLYTHTRVQVLWLTFVPL